MSKEYDKGFHEGVIYALNLLSSLYEGIEDTDRAKGYEWTRDDEEMTA